MAVYNPDKYAAAFQRVVKIFEDLNTAYISKIAKQIKKIGELNQSSVNRLLVMRDMGADIADINRQIIAATDLSEKALLQVYQAVLNDQYTDRRFQDFLQTAPPSTVNRDLARINKMAQLSVVQTLGAINNLSNTTVVDTAYRDAVDRAILATASGLVDYRSATRDILRSVGGNGLQVQYESGLRRRLDTAVRQNVTNAVKQLAQESSLMMGAMMGDDAVEISAHLRSAPDHEPVQGRVFLLSEFDKMQNGGSFTDIDGNAYEGFKRPIGEWNCGHAVSSYNTKMSTRVYSDAQLAEFASKNNAGCEIGGKHVSTYEASQIMRKIETKVRQQKDIANAAREAGDHTLQVECQKKINRLAAQYEAIAKTANLPLHKDRMTVEGFHMVKVPKTK